MLSEFFCINMSICCVQASFVHPHYVFCGQSHVWCQVKTTQSRLSLTALFSHNTSIFKLALIFLLFCHIQQREMRNKINHIDFQVIKKQHRIRSGKKTTESEHNHHCYLYTIPSLINSHLPIRCCSFITQVLSCVSDASSKIAQEIIKWERHCVNTRRDVNICWS